MVMVVWDDIDDYWVRRGYNPLVGLLSLLFVSIREVCNFVAYAFTEAILVTPLGALAVVVSAIGSSVFLRERLSFVGKVSCGLCMLGAAVIVVNAPSTKSATTIQDMQHYVVAPGFLSYAGVIIVLCVFLAFWAGPRYGKRVKFWFCGLMGVLTWQTMLVYLSM